MVSAVGTNWAGYVYCPVYSGSSCDTPGASESIKGVRASWNVPYVVNTSSGLEAEATWVGIGGFSTDDLIQAGVDAIPLSGTTSYSVWWEMLPAASTTVTLSPVSTVSPGDQIFVQIQYFGTSGGDQEWNFQIVDNTTSSSWSATEICGAGCTESSFSTADWIEESPEVFGEIVQLPAFGAVEMKGASYVEGSGSWANVVSTASTIIQVSLLNPTYSSDVLGLTSSIYASGTFWLQYLVDPADAFMEGSSGSVEGGMRETGMNVTGFMNLSSPDAFGASGPTRIGLAAELGDPSTPFTNPVTPCFVEPRVYTGLSVSSGLVMYSSIGEVCKGLPYGVYKTAMTLWYVAPESNVGEPASLLLFSTGLGSGLAIQVNNPTVQSVENLGSTGGRADVGEYVALMVGSYFVNVAAGPFTIDWTGLPPGCDVSMEFDAVCRPTIPGNFSINVVLTDALGNSASAPKNLTLLVFTDVEVTIQLNPGTIAQGASFEAWAIASGGYGGYSYLWSTSPASCSPGGSSNLDCMPPSSGTVRISIIVTDGNQWSGEASTNLTVVPGVFGLPLFTIVLPILAGVVLALVIGVILVRRRRRNGQDEEVGTIAERVREYHGVPGPSPSLNITVPVSEVWSNRSAPPGPAPVQDERKSDGPGETEAGGGIPKGPGYWDSPLLNPPETLCWNCQFQNPPASRYCARCGLPLQPPPRSG
jgi:hypothetical protein